MKRRCRAHNINNSPCYQYSENAPPGADEGYTHIYFTRTREMLLFYFLLGKPTHLRDVRK